MMSPVHFCDIYAFMQEGCQVIIARDLFTSYVYLSMTFGTTGLFENGLSDIDATAEKYSIEGNADVIRISRRTHHRDPLPPFAMARATDPRVLAVSKNLISSAMTIRASRSRATS
jgi:hypothetical protein